MHKHTAIIHLTFEKKMFRVFTFYFFHWERYLTSYTPQGPGPIFEVCVSVCVCVCVCVISSRSPHVRSCSKRIILIKKQQLLMLLAHFGIVCVMSPGPGGRRWSTEKRDMWLQLAGAVTASLKRQQNNPTALSSRLHLYFCLKHACLRRPERFL